MIALRNFLDGGAAVFDACKILRDPSESLRESVCGWATDQPPHI
jgi:hypothetical protein